MDREVKKIICRVIFDAAYYLRSLEEEARVRVGEQININLVILIKDTQGANNINLLNNTRPRNTRASNHS